MLLKKCFINNNTIYYSAGRKPINGAIAIGIAVQIGTIKGGSQLGITQIVEHILESNSITHRKTTHGNNIGQIIMLAAIMIIICGIGGKHKIELHIWKFLAQKARVML